MFISVEDTDIVKITSKHKTHGMVSRMYITCQLILLKKEELRRLETGMPLYGCKLIKIFNLQSHKDRSNTLNFLS